MRIDHRNGTLHFGSQQLETDKVRGHLTTLAKRLTKAVTMMGVPASAEKEARRAQLVQTCLDNLEKEHKRALARKVGVVVCKGVPASGCSSLPGAVCCAQGWQG